MKKFLLGLGAALTGGAVFADGSTVNTDVITGSSGVLTSVQSYIETVASNSWAIITAIVAVGLLIWLGRVMIRAVRAYFSTAM